MAAAGFASNTTIQEYGSGQYNALSVCTNACWALGEAIMTCTQENSPLGQSMKQALAPHIPEIQQRVVSMLSSQKLNRSLA